MPDIAKLYQDICPGFPYVDDKSRDIARWLRDITKTSHDVLDSLQDISEELRDI